MAGPVVDTNGLTVRLALQRAKLMTAGSSCTISEQQFISVGNKKSRQAFARRDLSHGIVKRTD
jgi:hypothetical protein